MTAKLFANDFWKINFGHVAVISVWLVTVGVWKGNLEAQITNHGTKIQSHAELIQSLVERLEKMDRDGSAYGQRASQTWSTTSDKILTKCDDLTRTSQALSLKMESLSVNIDWLVKQGGGKTSARQ